MLLIQLQVVTTEELIRVGEHVIIDHKFEENSITDNIVNITTSQENTIYIPTYLGPFGFNECLILIFKVGCSLLNTLVYRFSITYGT